MLLRKDTELRSIYSFYSRLGRAHSPDNTFLLTRLQLWRLLKDCSIHHHDITLAQMDHFIKGETDSQSQSLLHFPYTGQDTDSFIITVFVDALTLCLMLSLFFASADTTTETHSPFTPIPLRRLLSCLVIVAYHIYNKDMV